jgi:hypothetical protein
MFKSFKIDYIKVENQYGKYRCNISIDGTKYSPGFGKTKKDSLNSAIFYMFHLLKELTNRQLKGNDK